MPSESLRLFFALWPDAALRRAIRWATREVTRSSGGRIVAPSHFHLTLVFLGSQPRNRLASIMDVAASLPLVHGELILNRLGYFAASRVLWYGPRRTPLLLARHVNRLRRMLIAADLCPPGPVRDWRAHLSLVRKVAYGPLPTVRAIHWNYAGFSLIASESTATGVCYRVLAEWPGTRL